MKPVFYARVSRDDLHCANQKKVLIEWAKRNEVSQEEFDKHYFEEEISSRKSRPKKETIIQDLRSGKYDTLVVTRIDRFARSLQELIMNIEEIINNRGRFVSVMNSFDFQKTTYNASQQLMLNIFASFAQFEREMIRERTIEGLARAKAQGKKLGRPYKNPKFNKGVIHKTPSQEVPQIPSQTSQENKRTINFQKPIQMKGG